MSRLCDNWINTYMEYSSVTEAPRKMHFWSGVSAIASVLQKHVRFSMGRWYWYPNFYIVLVAPSGVVGKSSTLRVASSLTKEVDTVKFGPNSVTWQSLLDSFNQNVQQYQQDDGSFLPVCALTLYSSELGVLLNPKDREFIDVITDLYDSEDGEWKRQTRMGGEVVLYNPWLNIAACTTPSWIAENFPEGAIEGGLTSRIIFVYGEEKTKLIAYPFMEEREDKDLKHKLIKDLQHISQLKGEFTLTPKALQWGQDWYEKHWTNIPKHLATSRYGGYIARKQAHLHKLAMISSVARRDDLVIEVIDLEYCLERLNEVESDLGQVFRNVGKTELTKAMVSMIQIVKIYTKITRTELFRSMFHTVNCSGPAFEEALKSCIVGGFLRITMEGSEPVIHYIKGSYNESQKEVQGA